MDINIEVWPELFFKFGPYAILALFVLWVAPRASKSVQNLASSAPKAVRVSATATLFASWAVVLVMVGFVLFKWSPIRVYDGDLGVFKQSDKIYALDDNLYIKLEGTELANRFKSHFVLVDRERALKENDLLDFTYQWGTNDEDYTDYSIPLKEILAGKVKDFQFTHSEPGAAYVWSKGNWVAASTIAEQNPVAFNWHWNAYAGDDLQKLSKELASPNFLVRAKARKKLRNLTDAELTQLLEMSTDQNVIHQVTLEQQRRAH